MIDDNMNDGNHRNQHPVTHKIEMKYRKVHPRFNDILIIMLKLVKNNHKKNPDTEARILNFYADIGYYKHCTSLSWLFQQYQLPSYLILPSCVIVLYRILKYLSSGLL